MGVFGGSDDVGIVCNTVGFYGAATGDGSRKIGPVPLFNGKNQGVRTRSLPCAMQSNAGSGKTRTTSSTQARGGMTPSQSAATLSSCDTTPVIFGRDSLVWLGALHEPHSLLFLPSQDQGTRVCPREPGKCK